MPKKKITLQALKKPFFIEKISKTAKEFIQRAKAASSKKPRITEPPQKIPILIDPFIKHERDAFKMKAFTLLKGYSPAEKLKWLSGAPICRIIDPDSEEISLMQTLFPFPGEKIQLKGTFKRHTVRAAHTAPIAGSFQIQRTARFPHPLQHTGWALPGSERLLNQKERTLAEQWVDAKREAFNQNRRHFLKLHKKVMEALVGRHPALTRFFKENHDYDTLSAIHNGDRFQEPWIQEYQRVLKESSHPRLEECRELQLKAFLEEISRPVDDPFITLNTLISLDLKILTLA